MLEIIMQLSVLPKTKKIIAVFLISSIILGLSNFSVFASNNDQENTNDADRLLNLVIPDSSPSDNSINTNQEDNIPGITEIIDPNDNPNQNQSNSSNNNVDSNNNNNIPNNSDNQEITTTNGAKLDDLLDKLWIGTINVEATSVAGEQISKRLYVTNPEINDIPNEIISNNYPYSNALGQAAFLSAHGANACAKWAQEAAANVTLILISEGYNVAESIPEQEQCGNILAVGANTTSIDSSIATNPGSNTSTGQPSNIQLAINVVRQEITKLFPSDNSIVNNNELIDNLALGIVGSGDFDYDFNSGQAIKVATYVELPLSTSSTRGANTQPTLSCAPAVGPITQAYNPSAKHFGVDIASRSGSEIRLPIANYGTCRVNSFRMTQNNARCVSTAGYNRQMCRTLYPETNTAPCDAGFGNYIEIECGNTATGYTYFIAAHLQEIPDELQRIGAPVQPCTQIIGATGNSGRTFGSNGYHLHAEVRSKTCADITDYNTDGLEGVAKVLSDFRTGRNFDTFTPFNRLQQSFVDNANRENEKFILGLNTENLTESESSDQQNGETQLPEDSYLLEVDNTGVYNITVEGLIEEQIIIEANNAKVSFFYDTNGDSIKQANETYAKIASINVDVQPEKMFTDYTISQGWNALNLNLLPDSDFKASTLRNQMIQQGISAIKIAKFQDSDWQTFVTRTNAAGELTEYSDDFTIFPGDGIFVLSTTTGNFRYAGNAIANPLPLLLQPGWNLVGLSGLSKELTSESLLTNLANQEIPANQIARFESGRYTSVVKIDDQIYGINFNINSKEAYFIKLEVQVNTYSPNPFTLY